MLLLRLDYALNDIFQRVFLQFERDSVEAIQPIDDDVKRSRLLTSWRNKILKREGRAKILQVGILKTRISVIRTQFVFTSL